MSVNNFKKECKMCSLSNLLKQEYFLHIDERLLFTFEDFEEELQHVTRIDDEIGAYIITVGIKLAILSETLKLGDVKTIALFLYPVILDMNQDLVGLYIPIELLEVLEYLVRVDPLHNNGTFLPNINNFTPKEDLFYNRERFISMTLNYCHENF